MRCESRRRLDWWVFARGFGPSTPLARVRYECRNDHLHTEYFYPGVYQGEASINGHAKFIGEELLPRRELLKRWNAPYLVGDFNVVHEHTGGAPMMQHYWDLYESYGWAATIWSYKLLKAYFDKDAGNAYSLCRVNIHSCDFSLGNYDHLGGKEDPELGGFSIQPDHEWRIPFIKRAFEQAGGQAISSSRDDLLTTAYRRPDGKTVMVLMNMEDTAFDCQLTGDSETKAVYLPPHSILTIVED